MSDERFQQARFGAWIGIVGNIVLAVMKGVFGVISGSKALVADALRSATEAACSIVAMPGFRTVKSSPDKDYPYGQGKAESFTAIIISVILLLIGLETALSSVRVMLADSLSAPKPIAFIAIAVAIVVKEAMFQYKYRLGKRISSQSLMANAWKHRSDIYSSLVALVGAGGAILGHYLGNTHLYYLDPIAALCIAVLIIRTGLDRIRQTVQKSADHALQQEDVAELVRTVQAVKGIIAVDELRAREHGHYVIVDVKISVNPRISVMEGHDLAKRAKHMLMSRFSHIADVLIHVNPYAGGYPYKNNADSSQDEYPTLLH
ncbi:putative cation efflux system protein [Paenibacillus konkukensis]|uniref:Cation efflux system protein n=1 Tax=Paenibacillus konkukensis TaxID=2020716 RepID=A0ABY4RYQ8_9BACL|nr:cation diffusion facilitator family transporter [Paenibacillus konkukensis]UQZ86786.1 putative cation efflux system protein [Paenibacillus konkukensis]